MSMLKTLTNISRRYDSGESHIKDELFKLTADCENDYYKEQLATIPAGTEVLADFAGDFGMYGMVEVGGVLHRVKINLTELHKIDFGRFDGRNQVAHFALSPDAPGSAGQNGAHTPGPWEYKVQPDEHGPEDVVMADGLYIASCHFVPGGRVESNARLIAAAPQMLEALREADRRLHDDGYTVTDPVTVAVRAAIAAATGEEG
jgi:hypothetical protein